MSTAATQIPSAGRRPGESSPNTSRPAVERPGVPPVRGAYSRPRGFTQAVVLLLFLAICLAVEYSAVAVTRAAPDAWYDSLAKPSWEPLPWMFPVFWTIIYVLMAFAAWEAWRKAPWAATGALVPFFVQLALNAAWSQIFFGLGDITLAFVDILALLLAVLATTVAFAQRSRLAAWLMVPYILWGTYATALNGAVVLMNA